ncbi:MAG: MBL fold metallo-hydrolase [Planctomycetota bacterium]|nr:MBL fold metallo-hydrolase [Planctomycetota bacterium]
MILPTDFSIRTYRGGHDKNFSYLVGPLGGGAGFLIDAATDPAPILADAQKDGTQIQHILLTHTHADHLVSIPDILEATDAKVSAFRTNIEGIEAPIQALTHGSQIECGKLKIEVLHTPGHAEDHLCFLLQRHLFTGDTLFIGRTGRTVFPGSDTSTLFRSLQLLSSLPEDTRIYPGHDYGEQASDILGAQRQNNPFLRAQTEAEFLQVMADYEASRG